MEDLFNLVKELVDGSQRGRLYIDCTYGKIKNKIKNIFHLIITAGTRKGQ